MNLGGEIYPKLVAYHDWWLRNRDRDGNGMQIWRDPRQSPQRWSGRCCLR
ncbi:hypothetical protein ACNKHW_19530 [Shigella flexneri]